MSWTEVGLGLLIAVFTMLSGINDGGNLVGTYFSTPTVHPRLLLFGLILSVAAGPLLLGTRVSHTIAVEVVNFQHVPSWVLMMALFSAVVTLSVTWRMKIPTSVTLALAGGMLGAALGAGDARWISWLGILKILIGLIGSVSVGFCTALLLAVGFRHLLRRCRRVGLFADRMQSPSVIAQGLAYGANGQERAIGLAALWFMAVDRSQVYRMPWLAVVLPWLLWTIGLFVGGLYIAETVSGHVLRLRGVEAVTTQGAAALTVSAAALLGLPVSTTQTTDGSLFGTGTALNPYHVRWKTVVKFLQVWIWTLPVSVGIGFGSTWTIRRIHFG